MTSHPHDALFKSSLTPDAALALCRAVLPPEVSARFAGAELSPVPVTFIEPSLSEVRSDVCYSAKVGGAEALVYVLTEHLCGMPHKCSYAASWIMRSRIEGLP